MSPVFDDLSGSAKGGKARSTSMANDHDPFFKGSLPEPDDDRYLRPRPKASPERGLLDGGDSQFGAGDWLNIDSYQAKGGQPAEEPSMAAQEEERIRQGKLLKYEHAGGTVDSERAGNWAQALLRERTGKPNAVLPPEMGMYDISDLVSAMDKDSQDQKAYSDRGMLDDFDQEFSQGPLDDADFEPEEGMKVFHQSPLAQRSRRDSDYARVVNQAGQHWAYAEKSPATQARTPEEEAAHKLQLRDETRYLHGGQELSDEEGQNWQQNWSDRVAYDSRALKVAEPGAGWDKPKVGKFRSAMSWLGNKLTFGMLGGKDYRARQEALKQREALVKSAFTQRMTRFDEYQYDLNNEDAFDHEMVKKTAGDRYIGRRPRIRPNRPGENIMDHEDRHQEALENDVAGNNRYNNAPQWIKDSKFGRNSWDRLVSDSAGIGKKRMRVLDDFDD